MKTKRRLLNLLMVLAVVIIAIAGIFSVGKLKGWYGKTEIQVENEDGTVESVSILAENKVGTVNIERKGVAFSLNNEDELQDGDILETSEGASIDISYGENCLSFNESSEAQISISEDGTVSIDLKKGEMFADLDDSFSLEVLQTEVTTKKGVFFASAPDGSAEIGVLNQEVTIGNNDVVQAGQRASLLPDGVEISDLTLESMNQFLLSKAKQINETKTLCFNNSDIEQVEQQREAEQKAEEELALSGDTQDAGQDVTAGQDDKNQKTDASTGNVSVAQNGTDASSGNTSAAQSGADTSSQTTNAPSSQGGSTSGTANSNKTDASANNGTSNGGSSSSGNNSGGSEAEEPSLKCTVSIRCDAILSNMDALTEGKDVYVPSNGCILSATQVNFEQGETVFDVLKRVCGKKGIALEYSWSAMYNSYYIEGINNLYEFDCGASSGWTYKVNGWFPNYGCSSYTLQDGDTIVWSYTT